MLHWYPKARSITSGFRPALSPPGGNAGELNHTFTAGINQLSFRVSNLPPSRR
jgi:hypothetical protein